MKSSRQSLEGHTQPSVASLVAMCSLSIFTCHPLSQLDMYLNGNIYRIMFCQARIEVIWPKWHSNLRNAASLGVVLEVFGGVDLQVPQPSHMKRHSRIALEAFQCPLFLSMLLVQWAAEHHQGTEFAWSSSCCSARQRSCDRTRGPHRFQGFRALQSSWEMAEMPSPLEEP